MQRRYIWVLSAGMLILQGIFGLEGSSVAVGMNQQRRQVSIGHRGNVDDAEIEPVNVRVCPADP